VLSVYRERFQQYLSSKNVCDDKHAETILSEINKVEEIIEKIN